MNIADQMRDAGTRAGLMTDAELIQVGDWKVAASVNRQPQSFEMMDADYLAKEPVTVEVIKGFVGCTETIEIDGVAIPIDLRGNRPAMRMRCVIDNVSRAINQIQDCGTAWMITTVRRATAE